MKKIAVLLTCHNRREKTVNCLTSFYNGILFYKKNYSFKVFLVDDGSRDDTSRIVHLKFPEVKIIQGHGDLFWAGGMRKAWIEAINCDSYYAYLLLNDDVILKKDFFENFLETHQFSLKKFNVGGVYSSSTIDECTKEISYGGQKIIRNHLLMNFELVIPNNIPQPCDMTNANILWVSGSVVDKIGTFNPVYTHGIADYDYSLTAIKANIPVYLTPGIGGSCIDDHGSNWKSTNTSLLERIEFLKDPKGLAYKEYLYFIRKHFPLYLPYSFMTLWLKTLLPVLWEIKGKKSK